MSPSRTGKRLLSKFLTIVSFEGSALTRHHGRRRLCLLAELFSQFRQYLRPSSQSFTSHLLYRQLHLLHCIFEHVQSVRPDNVFDSFLKILYRVSHPSVLVSMLASPLNGHACERPLHGSLSTSDVSTPPILPPRVNGNDSVQRLVDMHAWSLITCIFPPLLLVMFFFPSVLSSRSGAALYRSTFEHPVCPKTSRFSHSHAQDMGSRTCAIMWIFLA